MISIAVDIGGTFTDVVAADAASGRYYTAKGPSTPPQLVDGVREGIRRVLAEADCSPISKQVLEDSMQDVLDLIDDAGYCDDTRKKVLYRQIR